MSDDDETIFAVLVSRGDHSGAAQHLNRRMLKLEKRMEDQKAQLDADVQALADAQTALKTQVDAVAAALPAFTTQIAALQQQVADLLAKQGQPGADISADLATLETAVGALKDDATELQTALTPPAPAPTPAA